MSSVVTFSYDDVFGGNCTGFPTASKTLGFRGCPCFFPLSPEASPTVVVFAALLAGWWLQLSLVVLVVDGWLVAGGFGCR